MAGLEVIPTGATGMVAECVRAACLAWKEGDDVRPVSRRAQPTEHPQALQRRPEEVTAAADHAREPSRMVAVRKGLTGPRPRQKGLTRWLVPLTGLYPVLRAPVPTQRPSLDPVGRGRIDAARRTPPGAGCEVGDIRDRASRASGAS